MGSKRIAILTSGGDSPGMNAALRALTRKGIHHGLEMIGVKRGYDGLIHGDMKSLQASSVAGIINHGGTMLKTARSEEFKSDAGFGRALQTIAAQKIDGIVVIGGDGSMAGARKLSEAGVPTLVIPGTIDNDMAGTEYTLGFDTALNTILDAVSKIRDSMQSHERVAVVEVMGRHGGHLTLRAGISCGAEAIIIPEVKTDMELLCQGLEQSKKRGKLYSIVMVAEGAGTAQAVAEQIAQRTSSSVAITVLGYIQRGGAPSAQDNFIGTCMGAAAVDYILTDRWNCLIAMQGGRIVPVPYAEAVQQRFAIDRNLYEMAGILA